MKNKNYDHLLSNDLQRVAKIGRSAQKSGDTTELINFWIEYADYLEKCGIISPSRLLLYDMILTTITTTSILQS